MEQQLDIGLLRFLNAWGKLQDFPGRMIDWTSEQVSLAHAEAVRKIEQSRSAEEIGETRGRDPGQEG